MWTEPCKVLLVEDHRDGASSTAMLLRRMGNYQIRVAHSPEQAHAIASTFHPDVVLMDIGLPGKDGHTLGRELKKLYPNVRIIALSGYTAPELMHRSIREGFDDHLIKPVDPDSLNSHVHDACTAACGESR